MISTVRHPLVGIARLRSERAHVGRRHDHAGRHAAGRGLDRILSQAGTKSPTCGGTIAERRFSIVPAGGAACGTFRVEITAVRNTGRKVTNPKDGAPIDETEQFIPARYNRQSELTAAVSDRGPNRFEFTLKSNEQSVSASLS